MADGVVRGIDDVLEAARSRIDRLEPEAAWAEATQDGALIVDIRCGDERRRDGVVPGAVHIPRTVLEWRVDPASECCNPHIGGRDRRLVLVCSDGFSSSLAAASLVDIGFRRAADVVGGFNAWRRAGLPVGVARKRGEATPSGMGPPD